MNKISVAIITKNEEAKIRPCLESVRWADDIVVVDSGSTDQTLQICREYMVRIFVEEWKGFAQQKNSAIAKTRHEWVLSLDADERVSAPLKEEIEKEMNGDQPSNGYLIPRKNFFAGRWIRRCGWFPDYNLRLFRKSKGRFQERAVHERVQIEGQVERLQNFLIHETYDSVGDFLQRMDRYSTLAAQEMLQEGKPFRLFYLVLRPPSTFVQMYLVRLGFLEGYWGFLLSALYSFYTFAKYSKLRELETGK